MIVLLILVFPVWSLISTLTRGNMFFAIVGVAATILIVPFLFIVFTDHFQKIILTADHISIEGWNGVPRVYAYEQIVDIESVIYQDGPASWLGLHVKLTFDDGKNVKIAHDIITARRFRKLLREKTGKIFRKKRKKKRKAL
jgi:hypothetical protein